MAEIHMGEDLPQPFGKPPGLFTQQPEEGWNQHHANDCCIEEDGNGQSDAQFCWWDWPGEGQPVIMTGPAVTVFHGQIKI